MKRRWSKRKGSDDEAAESRTKRCVWSEAEDKLLLELASASPTGKWTKIAKAVSRLRENTETGKTPKQCRERWHNCLDPGIKSAPWTLEEETRFFALHQQLGPKWSTIACELGGRTDNAVKNFFFCQLRKLARRVHKAVLEAPSNQPHLESTLYLAEHLRIYYLSTELPDKEHLRDRYIAEMVKKKMITSAKLDCFLKTLVAAPRCTSDTEDSIVKGQHVECAKLPQIPTSLPTMEQSKGES